ncbi:MAG: metallophosphoesterase [Candidatus ainarchaeum sp.]|nr:metallophosphoesterase [Candidatus ainarchaeum sp.]
MAYRILAATDLHADDEAAEKVLRAFSTKKFDALLVLGDITDNGPVSFALDFMESAGALNAKVFAVPGNMDPPEVLAMLEARGASIHAKKVPLPGNWELAGFGGSPRAGRGPTEFSEEEIYSGLRALGIGKNTIIASHSPPFGVSGFDTVPGGASVGSESLRRIIEEKKPAALVCGHIHENEGIARLGETLVVKVAPACAGRAAEIALGGGKPVKAELIRI